jgi:prevent-host-death family protein
LGTEAIMNRPTTETMKISDVRSNINSLVNEVYRHEKRVIIEKSGIPVAAVVSLEDIRRLDQLARTREERFKVIDRMQAAFADIPPDEIERMALQTIAEVRAERRARAAQTKE